jgi:hypothetical protein
VLGNALLRGTAVLLTVPSFHQGLAEVVGAAGGFTGNMCPPRRVWCTQDEESPTSEEYLDI